MRRLLAVLARCAQRWPTLICTPLLLALAACGGGGSSPTGLAVDDPAAVASLQFVGTAPLFTAAGQRHSLQVQALGANGQVLNVPISWQSSEPAVVAVATGTDAAAALTAQAGQGTAVITASVGAHRISAVAVVAAAAPGTVVLSDAQVIGEPQVTAASLPMRTGSTTTITLQSGVAAPAVGQLVLGQGSKAIAGQVVAVNGAVVTLALVPLDQLLPQLTLDLDLPLAATAARTAGSTAGRAHALASGEARARALAETRFSAAGFDCKAEGSGVSVSLAKKDVQVLGQDSLRYRVLWNSQRKLLRISGQPGVRFELEPTLTAGLTGKLDCQLELVDIPIPMPGPLGLFLGAGVPLGVGFTLEGQVPVAGVGMNLKGQASAELVVGFDCSPGCSSLDSATTSGSVTPSLVAPDISVTGMDLSGQVYAWAHFEGGARWSSTFRFEAIEAQAGLKFAATVATETTQAKDAASAGKYVLSFEAVAAPADAWGNFAALVGVALDKLRLEKSVTIGRSPTATLAVDRPSFKTGDAVRFQVDVDSSQVLFPLVGYNLASVRVYRKTVLPDGSHTLVLANEVPASSGQTQFILPWVATVDSSTDISFVAFVQTQLLSSLRWQMGLAAVNAGPAAGRLSTGEAFSCGITTAGGVRCWGANQFGQLGNGATVGLAGTDRASPVNVAGLASDMAAISSGTAHSCALTRGGAVKCWGYGFTGQLGDGSSQASSLPVDVTGLGSGVVAVSAGGVQSCALTSGGAVQCWGNNVHGTLGNGRSGSSTNSAVPVDVTGLGSGVAAISAGGAHTCALLRTGAVVCWGQGTSGQLGNGGSTNSSVPVAVTGLDSDVVAISAGFNSSCALSSRGTLQCWGGNGRGQLGNGSRDLSAVPVRVTLSGHTLTSVSVGFERACAATTSGAALCWGATPVIDLGNGQFDTSRVPAPVTGLGTGPGTAVKVVSAGTDHQCAIVGDGAVRCWGLGESGQLGDGKSNASLPPGSIHVSHQPVAVLGMP